MPAGRAERVARGHDARPGRIARVNRLLQPDVVAVARPDVAHGGETRAEHVVGIFDRGHAPEAVGEFEPAITADVGGAIEVDVHVDEAREQNLVAEVDMFRSEEHTSELQSLMRISYAVFCLKKKTKPYKQRQLTKTQTKEENR